MPKKIAIMTELHLQKESKTVQCSSMFTLVLDEKKMKPSSE